MDTHRHTDTGLTHSPREQPRRPASCASPLSLPLLAPPPRASSRARHAPRLPVPPDAAAACSPSTSAPSRPGSDPDRARPLRPRLAPAGFLRPDRGVKARSCWGWPCARSGWPTSTLACTRTGRGHAGASGSGRRSSPPGVALVYLLQDRWNHIVRQEEAAAGDERRSETATSEEPSYPANDHKEVAVMP
ncbi:hypothetical protein D1007_48026 [Hordeum vulgare]|nr:hypothetical protein D1007_48026 [Hordeum vulgare]